MIRRLLIAALLWWPGIAAAAPPASCLDPTQSWAWSYTTGPIANINYYLDSQVLAVAYNDGVEHLMNRVPLNVAQRFESIGYGVSPAPIWAGMRYSFLEILQSSSNCPLMAQSNTFLLSAPQHDTPQ